MPFGRPDWGGGGGGDPLGMGWRRGPTSIGGGNSSAGPCGDGPCLLGGGSGLPLAPSAPYTTYGSCGCLEGDVLVSLYDGTTKKASEVVDGDVLLGVRDGVKAPQVVRNRFEAFGSCIRIEHEQGEFICSVTHQVISDGGKAVTVAGLCPDEQALINMNGERTRILDISHVEPQAAYGWSAYPDANFVAGGILHHNKIFPPAGILGI